jgi:L,D-peptidoglycan transpeptidase YkuD (ErfK/YbiS/YcfS/YnhG family)
MCDASCVHHAQNRTNNQDKSLTPIDTDETDQEQTKAKCGLRTGKSEMRGKNRQQRDAGTSTAHRTIRPSVALAGMTGAR